MQKFKKNRKVASKSELLFSHHCLLTTDKSIHIAISLLALLQLNVEKLDCLYSTTACNSMLTYPYSVLLNILMPRKFKK